MLSACDNGTQPAATVNTRAHYYIPLHPPRQHRNQLTHRFQPLPQRRSRSALRAYVISTSPPTLSGEMCSTRSLLPSSLAF